MGNCIGHDTFVDVATNPDRDAQAYERATGNVARRDGNLSRRAQDEYFRYKTAQAASNERHATYNEQTHIRGTHVDDKIRYARRWSEAAALYVLCLLTPLPQAVLTK